MGDRYPARALIDDDAGNSRRTTWSRSCAGPRWSARRPRCVAWPRRSAWPRRGLGRATSRSRSLAVRLSKRRRQDPSSLRSVAAFLFGVPDQDGAARHERVHRSRGRPSDCSAARRQRRGPARASAVKSQPFGVVLVRRDREGAPVGVRPACSRCSAKRGSPTAADARPYFHNSIIILTSNVGTRGAKGRTRHLRAARLDRDREDALAAIGAVLAAFRPELVNRLDQIVVFHPLAEAEIATRRRGDRGRAARRAPGVSRRAACSSTSRRRRSARGSLKRGFSAELGARALRRHLDAALLAPATRMLAKAGSDGHGGTSARSARPDEAPPAKPAGSRLGEFTRATSRA